jgi:hypothetical protein
MGSGCHAPHPNPSHGGHRDRQRVSDFRISVAHRCTFAARQQPPILIQEEAMLVAVRNGRRLQEAPLPRATG